LGRLVVPLSTDHLPRGVYRCDPTSHEARVAGPAWHGDRVASGEPTYLHLRRVVKPQVRRRAVCRLWCCTTTPVADHRAVWDGSTNPTPITVMT